MSVWVIANKDHRVLTIQGIELCDRKVTMPAIFSYEDDALEVLYEFENQNCLSDQLCVEKADGAMAIKKLYKNAGSTEEPQRKALIRKTWLHKWLWIVIVLFLNGAAWQYFLHGYGNLLSATCITASWFLGSYFGAREKQNRTAGGR